MEVRLHKGGTGDWFPSRNYGSVSHDDGALSSGGAPTVETESRPLSPSRKGRPSGISINGPISLSPLFWLASPKVEKWKTTCAKGVRKRPLDCVLRNGCRDGCACYPDWRSS